MRKKNDSISRADLVKGLKQLGIASGDHVIVHSAMASFGRVEGGADTVIAALLDTVGRQGTLLAPTFGSTDEIFDVKKSSTNLGVIPETLRRHKGAVRSRHPLASVAAVGAKAAWFIKDHENSELAHGENTPYHRLYELNGKILLLGVDQDRNTFLHTAEELARLPYLKPKTGKWKDAAGRVRKKTWPFFPGPHRNFIGIQAWLEDNGLIRKARIGNCVAQVMPCQPLLDALLKRLRREPDLFLSRNPNLPDGFQQRADLFRARLRDESFILCADSNYTGRYFDQSLDNLKRNGIDQIVLSCVNGVPWPLIEQKQRRRYLETLKSAGISVAALRLAAMPDDNMLKLIRATGTRTLIAPICAPLERLKTVASGGIRILLETRGMTGAAAADHIAVLSRSINGIAAAFDPIAAVEAGEAPFLDVYTQTKMKRHIGALMISDGLATGESVQLERGLAEIKELISILRAKSFDGLFILRGPGPDDFNRTACEFRRILEELGS